MLITSAGETNAHNDKSYISGSPSIVPVEGATQASAPTAASPYGVNNENLPERLQEALRRLVLQFSTESELSRRQEVRRIRQTHQFWRGLQYLWWDERDQNWHLPFEQKMTDGSTIEDLPRYEFVTNIYQAFGLSLVSVLSQDDVHRAHHRRAGGRRGRRESRRRSCGPRQAE